MTNICLSNHQVATAIFEYLEKRKKIPNRKQGITITQDNGGNLQFWVKITEEKK
jgi:hypothetical protein